MKYIAMAALLLTLGVTTVPTEQTTVKMRFSGTSAPSTVNLLYSDASSNDEDNFAGNSALGSFSVRNIRALPNSPTPSSSCSGSNLLHFTELHGGSVIRFEDDSLLYLNLTEGRDCIDIATGATLVGFTGAYPYDGREAVHSTALTKSAADFNWSRRPSPFLVDDGKPGSYQLARRISTDKRFSSERSIAGEKPTYRY
jgi:hypothetical protein